MKRIRELFSPTRPIDRRIEKVIDYAATEESRLRTEIDEYVVTPAVEKDMLRFLEAFDAGVRSGNVAQTGVWVSGFYGSGKSSFTKYLGFALDSRRMLGNERFVEHLAKRIADVSLRQLLKTVATKSRTAVFMLDLATSQIADNAAVPVSKVLYRHVLTNLGFSREPKVAELELHLDEQGRLDEFRKAYSKEFGAQRSWDEDHNDPRLAVLRAGQLATKFLPQDYPTAQTFSGAVFDPLESVAERAERILTLVRRKRDCENVVFFVDEVGQYVAPRSELILNLDGLVRSFKEIGRGHAWFVATAQQTLTETSEQAARNSSELFRLRDRFPITIELEATDIRDITAQRLLTKTPEGTTDLKDRFAHDGQRLRAQTQLRDWPRTLVSLDADSFARFYPFLPDRFDLVLELIRALARRTGGTGLRSAIRLVQDVLVDASHVLPSGTEPVADRSVGRIVDIADLFDTLRFDLEKEHPQAAQGVQRVISHSGFASDPLAIRVAKAVAVLQPLENHPRTAANIAALLTNTLGADDALAAVEAMLRRMVDAREFGLVELRGEAGTAGGTGFVFLSDEVQPLQKKRDAYLPTGSETEAERRRVVARIFEPPPETSLEGARKVVGAVVMGKARVVGEGGEIAFVLEGCDAATLEDRRNALEAESHRSTEDKIYWIYVRPDDADARLQEAVRSSYIQSAVSQTADNVPSGDVARFLRAESRRAEYAREQAKSGYERALHRGSFVFRGVRRAVEEFGPTAQAASTGQLKDAAGRVFEHFGLVKKNVAGDVAGKFLEVDRLDRMPAERDPLKFVGNRGGKVGVDLTHPALRESLREFKQLVVEAGTGRVQGSALLDHFLERPYGWSKDTTRYVFAALLVSGEVQIHTADLVLKTAGPKSIEAVRNTQSFGRIAIALRDAPVPIEALDRAAQRLEAMFQIEVLPLEDQISRAVRTQFPIVVERIASLPDRLRLLGLPGVERARKVIEACTELLRGDAGSAASVLGAVQQTLPSDVEWARGVSNALDAGSEQLVLSARAMVGTADEIAQLFPALSPIASSQHVATLREVLKTEAWHDRASDLRSSTSALESDLQQACDRELRLIVEEVETFRMKLESRPGWAAMDEDDRDAQRQEMTAVAQISPLNDPAAALRHVATLHLGLAAQMQRWHASVIDAEARRSIAADRATAPDDAASSSPATIMIGDHLPASPIHTHQELDAWLAELRAVLADRLAHGPIVLVAERSS